VPKFNKESNMLLSSGGLNLLKQFESCSLKSYRDIDGVLTIGYGHTGVGVNLDLEITPQHADELLLFDVGKFEITVENSITTSITQNQFDACVCLCYNIGQEAFLKSTVLKLINENANIDDIKKAWLEWDEGKGKVIQGLENRRESEFNLYLQN
jgi:lysozyme